MTERIYVGTQVAIGTFHADGTFSAEHWSKVPAEVAERVRVALGRPPDHATLAEQRAVAESMENSGVLVVEEPGEAGDD